jgi:serine/threonine-protein phosphatase 2A activator
MIQEGEASTSYRQPSKHILSTAHLAAFRRSTTHEEITQFISDLNSSIVGKTLNDVGPASDVSRTHVAELTSSAPNNW